MTSPHRPTFGQLLGFLRGLGFTTDEVRDGTRICRRAASDSLFLFRERPPDEPTREHELLATRTQLNFQGLATEADFDRFCAEAAQRR